jgi:O-antigen ligase
MHLAKYGRSRSRVGDIIMGLLLLGCTGVLGLATVYFGYLVPLVVLGVAACLLMFYRPFFGVFLVVLLLPLENMFIVGASTGVKLVGLVVFGAWALRKLFSRESWGPLFSSSYLYAAALFVLLAFASQLWAQDTSVVPRGALQLLMLFGWSVVVLDVVKSHERADWLARALVIGVLVAALVTIQQFYGGGARRAGDMVAGGVNATATVLVTTLPFSFYLLRGAESRFWRLVGLAAIVLSLIAGATTFARMTLLVVPPLLILLVWDAVHDRKARRWVVGLGIIALPILAAYIPWERVHDRAETIGGYLTGGRAGESSLATTADYGGRVYHLKVGLAIALDYPILGAGYDNYGTLFLDEYQFKVPGAGKIFTSRRSPHSTYLGIAADLGLVGLVVWFSVLFAALRPVLRGWQRKRGLEATWAAGALSRAIVYALLLYVLPYAWYMPHHTDKIMWTLLGMSVAMGHLSERRWPGAYDDAASIATPRPRLRHAGAVSD